jgi:hypothetical protein
MVARIPRARRLTRALPPPRGRRGARGRPRLPAQCGRAGAGALRTLRDGPDARLARQRLVCGSLLPLFCPMWNGQLGRPRRQLAAESRFSNWQTGRGSTLAHGNRWTHLVSRFARAGDRSARRGGRAPSLRSTLPSRRGGQSCRQTLRLVVKSEYPRRRGRRAVEPVTNASQHTRPLDSCAFNGEHRDRGRPGWNVLSFPARIGRKPPCATGKIGPSLRPCGGGFGRDTLPKAGIWHGGPRSGIVGA